ncbi:MAG TPA: autoinducer 2 ABC transporter substrate-binding protein, partial [Polyangia bacterium]
MKRLPTVAALGILCAAGCTAHNPSFIGDGGGGGGGAAVDLAGVTLDLAGVVFDLSGPMGACSGD